MINIVFRIDTKCYSPEFRRCLGLASAFIEIDPACQISFLSSCPKYCKDMIENLGYFYSDPGGVSWQEWDIEATEKFIKEKNAHLLFVGNRINDRYLKALKDKVKIVLFDDGTSKIPGGAQALINPQINSHLIDYGTSIQLFLGTEVCPLPSSFDEYSDYSRDNPERVRKITIITKDLRFSIAGVKLLKMLTYAFNAAVILSEEDHLTGESLAKEIGLDSRFVVLPAFDIIKRLASSDLIIISPDMLNEVLFFRLPNIILTESESQLASYAAKNGISLHIPIHNISKDTVKLVEKLMEDQEERNRISARMAELIDGLGRFRLAQEILDYFKD